MSMKPSEKGYLVFQSNHALVTNMSCTLTHPALSLRLQWCCCPVLYLSPLLLRRVWERWLYCCGSCLLRLSGNLILVYLVALAEGRCSIQGRTSKILNSTMRWQRDLLTMRTMARTELCIPIFLLLIFRFGEVLKCTSAVCAVFMVKAKHATLAE